MEFEIYFDDLNEQAQEDLLECCGIKDVHEETNWDIEPIAVVVYDIEGR